MEVKGYTIGPGADLQGAHLLRADLRGAHLQGAIGVLSAGFDARGYHFFAVRQEEGYRVHAGCRWFTPKGAIEHWEVRHDTMLRASIFRKLEMLDGDAEALGWV